MYWGKGFCLQVSLWWGGDGTSIVNVKHNDAVVVNIREATWKLYWACIILMVMWRWRKWWYLVNRVSTGVVTERKHARGVCDSDRLIVTTNRWDFSASCEHFFPFLLPFFHFFFFVLTWSMRMAVLNSLFFIWFSFPFHEKNLHTLPHANTIVWDICTQEQGGAQQQRAKADPYFFGWTDDWNGMEQNKEWNASRVCILCFLLLYYRKINKRKSFVVVVV